MRLNPDFGPAYINLGRVLEERGEIGTAVSSWITLVERLKIVNGESVKNKLLGLIQIGRVLEGQEQYAPAEDAMKQALESALHNPKSSSIGLVCANGNANGRSLKRPITSLRHRY